MNKTVASRFNPGDRVQVRMSSHPGHCRTPAYIQGKAGQVEVICGSYHNPEGLAYGHDGLPKQFLYQVAFLQRDIWGEAQYNGPSNDTVCVDLYDHWLETAQVSRTS